MQEAKCRVSCLQEDKGTNCIERLAQGNLVSTDEQKQAVFLSVIGETTYKLIRNLVVPEKQDNIRLKTSRKKLTNHYSPIPSEIVQR